uniref:Uncharacterized protein n=1 Tax=Cyanoderma ruficeps TaxID=181631 RepID=A0A8C3QGK9_9PASS
MGQPQLLWEFHSIPSPPSQGRIPSQNLPSVDSNPFPVCCPLSQIPLQLSWSPSQVLKDPSQVTPELFQAEQSQPFQQRRKWTGVEKREEKLEWMYQGPGGMVNREEYLMGRPVDKFILDKVGDRDAGGSGDTGLLPGSIFARAGASSVLDMATKIREDPLFMIRCVRNTRHSSESFEFFGDFWVLSVKM